MIHNYQNKIMKFTKHIILTFALLLAGIGSAMAQANPSPQWKFIPLINGYNVMVATNLPAPGLGVTNVLFTTYKGTIAYSWDGPSNSYWYGQSNNLLNQDAFTRATLEPDANGDINANAAFVLAINQTNYIPIASISNLASYASLVIATNWPLGYSTGGGVSQFLVGTNIYPLIGGSVNTPITVTLFAGAGGIAGVNSVFSQGNPDLSESTGTFQFTFTPSGAPQVFMTNLPAVFLQHAQNVYMSVTNSAGTAANGAAIVINQAGIMQPQLVK